MKLLVSGTRAGFNPARIEEILDVYLRDCRIRHEDLVIIEGCANGVDTQANAWAQYHAVPVLHYPAPWNHLGRKAGLWRNRAMLKILKPDKVVCFHPDIAKGKGTRDMALIAARAGIPVHLVGSTMPLPSPQGDHP